MWGSGRRTLVIVIVTQLVLAGAGMAAQPVPMRATDREVETLLARLAKNAEQFRRSLAETPDHEWAVGWKTERNINHFVTAFVQSTERLRTQFGRDQAVAVRVDEVLRRGVSVDSFMERDHSWDQPQARADRDWATVRRDLEALALAYGVPWHRSTTLVTDRRPDPSLPGVRAHAPSW